MSSTSKGLFFWCTRLAMFGAWATLVLLWRRGGYLGLPVESEALRQGLPFFGLLVLLPGLILLPGAPLARYAAGFLGVFLLGAVIAESVAPWQEQRLVTGRQETQSATVIEVWRFPGPQGGRMVFIRSPDGSESLHFND
jgi:hypothetical protein